MSEVCTADIVLDSFADAWRTWRDGSYTFNVAKGGRNSAKSTHISLALVLDVIEHPINVLVMRKVSRTLQESVYEQIKEATNLLGCYELFKFGVSPLKITYTPRGNGFIFRGADDTQKIKSLKTASFPIARCWVEEVTEFKMEEELQVIVDTILRADLPSDLQYKFFYSYNPPKRKGHWVNKKYETHMIPENTFVHHSSYTDNHYLSAQAIAVVDQYRLEMGENKYRWYYLGEPTGGGVVPFDNLTFRTITSEEIEHFDNIRQGLDFGYAVDPLAFVRAHYDKRKRTLYVLDEIYGVKMSNREFAEAVTAKGYNHTRTIADSAEPKSISELKDKGVSVIGARKGEGSVEYGEKWLDDLNEIVIDPARTPNTAREFENIDYACDKDGTLKARLEEKDDHTIASLRYACENDMNRSTIGFLRGTQIE